MLPGWTESIVSHFFAWPVHHERISAFFSRLGSRVRHRLVWKKERQKKGEKERKSRPSVLFPGPTIFQMGRVKKSKKKNGTWFSFFFRLGRLRRVTLIRSDQKLFISITLAKQSWLLNYGRRKNKRRPLSTSSRRWCMKNIIDYSRHLPVLFPYGSRCLFT